MLSSSNQPKHITMIGGPNGAGKTTCAFSLMPELIHCDEYVNADIKMINYFLQACKYLYNNENENCLIIADEQLSNIFFYRIEVIKKNNVIDKKNPLQLIYSESLMVDKDEYITDLSEFDSPLKMIHSLLEDVPILTLNNDPLGPKLSISDILANRLVKYYTPLVKLMEMNEILEEMEYMGNTSELDGIKETFLEKSIIDAINKSKEKAIDPVTEEAIIDGHLEEVNMEDRITYLVPDEYKTDEILDAGLLVMMAKEGISIEALKHAMTYAKKIRNPNDLFTLGNNLFTLGIDINNPKFTS